MSTKPLVVAHDIDRQCWRCDAPATQVVVNSDAGLVGFFCDTHGELESSVYLHRRPEEPISPATKTFDWLQAERGYQVRKFGTDNDDEHTQAGLDYDAWWWHQLVNYYHRAKVLGLETPVGRQALAKFVATGCGLLESVIRVHGDIPPAGVSSGNIEGEQS